MAAAATRLLSPDFTYEAIPPKTVGLAEYYLRSAADVATASPLESYLQQFEQLSPERPPSGNRMPRSLLLIAPEFSEIRDQPMKDLVVDVAKHLVQRGWRLAVAGFPGPSLGMRGGVLLLGAADRVSKREAFPHLGRIDAAVSFAGSDALTWVDAAQRIALDFDERAPAPVLEERIVRAIDGNAPDNRIDSQPVPGASRRQQVLFIGRVLWGGGAERVMYDLCHGLNRNEFEPIAITLFQCDNEEVVYDPTIRVECAQEWANGPPMTTPKREGDVVDSQILSLLKRVYHALLPPEIRMRIGIRRRANRAKEAWSVLLRPRRWSLASVLKFAVWALTLPIRIVLSAVLLKESNRRLAEWIRKSLRAYLLGPQYADSLAPTTDRIFHQTVSSLHALWAQVRGIQNLLRTVGEDAILVPMMEEALVATWLAQLSVKRRYVGSLHTVESQYFPILYPDPERLMVERWLLTNACQLAEYIVLPGVGCAEDLTEFFGVDPERLRAIPNPVNCAQVRFLANREWPSNFPRIDAKTVLVHSGRLSVEKNHELLISACELLKARYDDFVVVCIGKGGLRDTLQSQIDRAGLERHVLFLGELKNPFPLMARARALVLTSRFESFALVLVEAMICGAAVVSVDCPHGPREVLNNGEYGLLVPPDDPDTLADAMWKIATDDELHQRLCTLGVERAELYDIGKVVKEWEKLIRQVHANSHSFSTVEF